MKRLFIVAILTAAIHGQLCLRHPIQRGLSADCSETSNSCIGTGPSFGNAPQCTQNNVVSGFMKFSNNADGERLKGLESGSEDGVTVLPSVCGGTWTANDPPSMIPESNVWITGSSVVVDIILVNDVAGGNWMVDFSPTPYPSGSKESPSRDNDAIRYDFQVPLEGTCAHNSPGHAVDATQGVSQVSCTIDVPASWQTNHGILRAIHRSGDKHSVACASIRVVTPDHYRFMKNTLCAQDLSSGGTSKLGYSDLEGCDVARQEGFSNLPSSAASATLGVAVAATVIFLGSY